MCLGVQGSVAVPPLPCGREPGHLDKRVGTKKHGKLHCSAQKSQCSPGRIYAINRRPACMNGCASLQARWFSNSCGRRCTVSQTGAKQHEKIGRPHQGREQGYWMAIARQLG